MALYIKTLTKWPTIEQLNKLKSNFDKVRLTGFESNTRPHGISVEITPEQSLIAIGMALDELGIN